MSALLVIGVLLLLVGTLWLLAAAWSESPLWLLICLLPIGSLLFVMRHGDRAALPFGLQIIGWILFSVGTVGSVERQIDQRQASFTPPSQQIIPAENVTPEASPPFAPKPPKSEQKDHPEGLYAVEGGTFEQVERQLALSPLWKAYFAERTAKAAAKPYLRFRVKPGGLEVLDTRTDASIAVMESSSRDASESAALKIIALDVNTTHALLPKLCERLERYSPTFNQTLELIASLGPRGKDAFPGLANAFRRSGSMNFAGTLESRRILIKAMDRVEPAPENAVPVWALAITDREAEIRAWGEQSLARLAPEAQLERLTEALKDPEPAVRQGAAEALGKRGSKALGALNPLAELVLNEREVAGVRQTALMALADIGPTGSPKALAALVGAARDNNLERLRETALAALKKVGLTADPIWITIMSDPKAPSSDRCFAAKMLGRPDVSKAAMSALIGALNILEKRGESPLRTAIIVSLGECGAAAADALPTLKRLSIGTWADSVVARATVIQINDAMKAETKKSASAAAKKESLNARIFVLKDGRRLEVRNSVDGGDSYTVKDALGRYQVILKSEVVEIIESGK